MFNSIPVYASEQNRHWLRYQSNATVANNNMHFKAQEEQEKLYAKKHLLFDYYKTLYKKD